MIFNGNKAEEKMWDRIDSTQLLLSSSLVAIENLHLSLKQFRLQNQGHSSAEADYNIIYR